MAVGDRSLVTGDYTEAGRFDLMKIWRRILAERYIIGLIVLVSLMLAFIAYLLTDPVYSATARVAIERRAEQLVNVDNKPNPLTADSAVVDTEVQKLRSPDLAAMVVSDLGLADNEEFAASDVPADAKPKIAARTLMSNLSVRREGESFAIAISYSSGDAKLAADIVNSIVENYRNSGVELRSSDREREVALLDERLDGLRSDMVDAEAAVAQYQTANGIVDASEDSQIREQEISILNTELAEAQALASEARGRLAALRGGASGQGNMALATLRGQQAQIEVERQELLARYGPRHPALASANEQLATINRNISNEMARSANALRAEAIAASQKAASLRQSLAQARGSAMNETAASVRLNELQRNAESARELYQTFLNRYRQALAEEGTDKSNASIISLAQVPTNPDWPSLPVFLALGLVFGLLISALYLLVKHLMQRGFLTRQQLQQRLGIPMIGGVPDLKTVQDAEFSANDPVSPSNFMLDEPGSIYADAIRGIRARITRSSSNINSLAITSAQAGEGKTTLAMSIARSAAVAGKRVLLIDVDLRRRTSTRSLAQQIPHGLVEVLSGEIPLQLALILDESSGAYLLPQRPDDKDNYDALSEERLSELLNVAKQHFDLVILDCPPILLVAETQIVAAAADAALLAVRWRSTPAELASAAVDQLNACDANVYGSVMTLIDYEEQAKAGDKLVQQYYSYTTATA